MLVTNWQRCTTGWRPNNDSTIHERIWMVLLVTAIYTCASGDTAIGPAIGDLEEMSTYPEAAETDPRVTFKVDRQPPVSADYR